MTRLFNSKLTIEQAETVAALMEDALLDQTPPQPKLRSRRSDPKRSADAKALSRQRRAQRAAKGNV